MAGQTPLVGYRQAHQGLQVIERVVLAQDLRITKQVSAANH